MLDSLSSIKDPHVILARELHTAQGRKDHHKCLLYGIEQLELALASGAQLDFIVTHDRALLDPLTPMPSCKVFTATEGVLKKISDTSYLIPIIAVAYIPNEHTPDARKDFKREDFIIVADHIKDYGNLGSLIRTAQAFSVNSITFSTSDTDPFQRKVIDSARGLQFKTHFSHYSSPEETIAALQKKGYLIIVTSPHASTLQSHLELNPGKPIALVLGNETDGVDRAFTVAADIAIFIPMNPAVESLNVTVAAGISLYELTCKQVLSMLREKIITNLGRQVNVSGKLIRLVFEQAISKKTDLSGEHVILLMIMHCDRTMTAKQIALDVGLADLPEFEDPLNTEEDLGLSTASTLSPEQQEIVERFLHRLHVKKFIHNERGNYSLTPEGERFLAEIWPIVEQVNHKILSQFSAEEIHQLHNLLSKLQTNCDDMLDE